MQNKLKNAKERVSQKVPRKGGKTKKPADAPRITNESVAEYREQMLAKSRRYIYPLKQSRVNIVSFSIKLLVVLIVAFFVFCGLALYKFQNDSTFMYRLTEVIPFPVAKAGSRWVSYESYLFQLRHYKHYYKSQQQLNFKSKQGQQQLALYKKQALQQAIDSAYVKQLAATHNVHVSDQEVTQEVKLLRQQNRLGTSRQQFADVLQEFWGWTIDDFRHELRQQLLAQKVVATLDKPTHQHAKQALAELHHGTKFAKVAKQFSDDGATKADGGEYNSAITRDSRDVAPQVVHALFHMKKGQTSGIIDAGYSLQIVKVLSKKDGKVHAAHIALNYANVDDYLKPLKDQHPPHRYISIKGAPQSAPQQSQQKQH
jgi:parvulin-like peptidyl-prolyl isomerase